MELLNVLGGLGDIKKLETAYKELLDEYRDFNKASRALEFGNKVWMAEEGSVEDSFRALSGKDCTFSDDESGLNSGNRTIL